MLEIRIGGIIANMEDELLGKKEAALFLGLDSRAFDNYFRNAQEFPSLDRPKGNSRFRFRKSVLNEWQTEHKWRTVALDLDEYLLCLDFALAMHFRGYVASDWGTGRQREFGQKITNWIKGQLGEVAVKKFLEKNFGVKIQLDFGIHPKIVPQDIIGIEENGRIRNPGVNVAIKSSKPKSSYLVLSPSEVSRPERRSDIYIFCRVDIPDDHLLRLTRRTIIKAVGDKQHFSLYRDEIPSFSELSCEIAGFCPIDELEERMSIPGQDFDGPRFVRQSGLLRRSKKEWDQLVKRL